MKSGTHARARVRALFLCMAFLTRDTCICPAQKKVDKKKCTQTHPTTTPPFDPPPPFSDERGGCGKIQKRHPPPVLAPQTTCESGFFFHSIYFHFAVILPLACIVPHRVAPHHISSHHITSPRIGRLSCERFLPMPIPSHPGFDKHGRLQQRVGVPEASVVRGSRMSDSVRQRGPGVPRHERHESGPPVRLFSFLFLFLFC